MEKGIIWVIVRSRRELVFSRSVRHYTDCYTDGSFFLQAATATKEWTEQETLLLLEVERIQI